MNPLDPPDPSEAVATGCNHCLCVDGCHYCGERRNPSEAVESVASGGTAECGCALALGCFFTLDRTACDYARVRGALRVISEIRDSIVGRQTINWSRHIYPLVAALDSVGFVGVGHEIARKKAIQEDEYRARLEAANISAVEQERDSLRNDLDNANAEIIRLTAQTSRLEQQLARAVYRDLESGWSK